MARVDRIWNGAPAPMTVTQGVTTASIGLALEDWQVPMDVVCARLELALETAFAPTPWTVTANVTTGAITITSTVPFDVTFAPGFAAFWGFASTTYLLNLSLTSDGMPTWLIPTARVRFGLPVCWWSRAVGGDRQPVVWDGPFVGFDVEVVTSRFAGADPFDLARVPFCISQGDALPWTPTNRNGWIGIRPLADQTQRAPVGSGADWGKLTLRGVWLDPEVGP